MPLWVGPSARFSILICCANATCVCPMRAAASTVLISAPFYFMITMTSPMMFQAFALHVSPIWPVSTLGNVRVRSKYGIHHLPSRPSVHCLRWRSSVSISCDEPPLTCDKVEKNAKLRHLIKERFFDA